MTENEKKQVKIKINIPEKVQAAIFSNVAQIHATDREVIIDFTFIQPNTNEGIMVSRIALTPEHAFSLRDVLVNTLKRYENKK